MRRVLRGCSSITFSEPHFTRQLLARGGRKEEVLRNLRDPELLVMVSEHAGRYGDTVYDLSFNVADRRTMIIPVIVDERRKSLYVLTYILRHRSMRS
jgi:hypothetical protein